MTSTAIVLARRVAFTRHEFAGWAAADCLQRESNNGCHRGSIGCAGRDAEQVSKRVLDRPLKVWATDDAEYNDVISVTLDRLSLLLCMTITNTHFRGGADLLA